MKKSLRDLDQLRARYALNSVKKRQGQFEAGSRERERYLNRVKNLPATIVMNGLSQSVATLLAAAKGAPDSPDFIIYEELKGWLCSKEGIFPEADLMDSVVNCDREKYLSAQLEALKLLEWQKKFATAFLSKKEAADDASAT